MERRFFETRLEFRLTANRVLKKAVWDRLPYGRGSVKQQAG
jgi:hypothetical protein